MTEDEPLRCQACAHNVPRDRREHAERPENGAEPIKTDQRGIWDCSNDSWERLPERYDDAFRDKEARVKAEVEMIEEQRERTW